MFQEIRYNVSRDRPFGHWKLVLKDSWSLTTDLISMIFKKAFSYNGLLKQWSLKTVVSQDRFHCSIKQIQWIYVPRQKMLVCGKKLLAEKLAVCTIVLRFQETKNTQETYSLETINQSNCSSLIKYSKTKPIFKLGIL